MRGTGSCATGSHSSNPNAKTPHFRDRVGELVGLFRQREEDAIRSFGPRGRDGRCPPAKRSSPTSASICFSRLGGSQRGGMVVNRPARASGIDAVGLHAGGMDFLLPSRGVAHELGTSGNDN